MQKFPSFSELQRKIHYWLYEQPEKPRKMIQNQLEIMLILGFATPSAFAIGWLWWANLSQYNWVVILVWCIVAPFALVDWVRHRKERAEEKMR